MKVVITDGYFDLSILAEYYYLKLHGFLVHLYHKSNLDKIYTRIDNVDQYIDLLNKYNKMDIYERKDEYFISLVNIEYTDIRPLDFDLIDGLRILFQINNNRYSIVYYDMRFRTDPLLIKTVEDIGGEHCNHFGDLFIVEVPDNMNYYINIDSEFPGETIAQCHYEWDHTGKQIM